MGTEIAKSKISQELRDRAALLNLDVRHWQQVKFLNKAADAIDELNQRLIDQTASGMERVIKDQEEIKRLNRELVVSKEIIECFLKYESNPPDLDCDCPPHAPCADCIDYSDIRFLIERATSLINQPYPQKEGA